MSLVRLVVPRDALHATVQELGDVGSVQFKDLNPNATAFQRHFAAEVRRGDEMMRRVRYLATSIEAFRKDLDEDPDMSTVGLTSDGLPKPVHGEEDPEMPLMELQGRLEELESELSSMEESQKQLMRNLVESTEQFHVLKVGSDIMAQGAPDFGAYAGTGTRERAGSHLESHLLDDEDAIGGAVEMTAMGATADVSADGSSLGHVTGVIDRASIQRFERTLFRATRGNIYLRHEPVEEKVRDTDSLNFIDKDVFVVFYSGERLRSKISRICQGFQARLYSLPLHAEERRGAAQRAQRRRRELVSVVNETRELRFDVLKRIVRVLPDWERTVQRELAVRHTMNMFHREQSGSKSYMGECWVPTDSVELVAVALNRAAEKSGADVRPFMERVSFTERPPTYFRTNKYTAPFQGIVDAYGVPRYRELNPAVFTVITFPFLFAVMFGDIGHGLIMLLFSLWLVRNEAKFEGKKLNEFLETAYGGRYVLLLMSFFAIYTGLMYNETFAVPLDLFGTKWEFQHPPPVNGTEVAVKIPGTYAIGVDPGWSHTDNRLNFFNSLKMKLSIIFGIVQMNLGLLCKAANGIHFKDYRDFFLEFVPEIIFLNAIFGWLVLLIVIKWSKEFVPSLAPSLLDTMIDMFMKPGTVGEDMNVLSSGELQGSLQSTLLLIAFLTVPIMLFAKPLAEKRAAEKGYMMTLDDAEEAASGGIEGGHSQGEGFNFGEVMVHQLVHTIEFVLGSVSNTASYLRLWALSLAHSQLSEVFYEKVLVLTMEQSKGGSPIFVIVGFAIWFSCTLGVLMIMETLSAFLHALRLHWVEFQNKFYGGDGIPFEPFNFTNFKLESSQE